MLQDVDLKYRDGSLATTKSLIVDGSLTVAGVLQADPSSWLPADHGYLSWSYDPSVASSNTTVTNGTVYLSALRIRRPTLITKVHWLASTAGAVPTSGQNEAGLYSSAGVRLSTVNIDAKVTNANSAQEATLGTPQTVAAGFVWVGLVFNAGTPPTLLRTNGAFTGTNNANLGTSVLRYATNSTSQTVLPSPITPASNATGPSLWVAVS